MIRPDYFLSRPLEVIMEEAAFLRDAGFGSSITFSKKVFIPLTRLCRDVCHYCVYAKTPRNVSEPYLSLSQSLEIAQDGDKLGCKEALITLGDKPEMRYSAAREFLDTAGYSSTVEYVEATAQQILDKTNLLPHLNPGVLTVEDYRRLRSVSASMGLMLESGSTRLCERGGPHHGSPDKDPDVRYNSIKAAGIAGVPFTTGLLVGIGETRVERLADLFKLHEIHREYGHIQDLIIQPFRAKPGTLMSNIAEPSLNELLWTVASARIIFGPEVNIQAPPNLSAPQELPRLVRAGINDWGGISPLTPDHVNPEYSWPQLEQLEKSTHSEAKELLERLAIVPSYATRQEEWLDKSIAPRVLRLIDADGLPRSDGWIAGVSVSPPEITHSPIEDPSLRSIIGEAADGHPIDEDAITALFRARGRDVHNIIEAADAVRANLVGDAVTYVVNRNINYTNICLYSCQFCAFSKGRGRESLRGKPYRLDLGEVTRRVVEACNAGSTEVCMQGGIHPEFDGVTYLDILRAVRKASPDVHIHAFSPLEVSHGAGSLGRPVGEYLSMMKELGLGSLPGTAAEVLHDDVRAVLCPDKIDTAEWLQVMETAHDIGLKTTATIMFGHVDAPEHWARHLMLIKNLQAKTGGFTEFVPLPFVHMQAPIAMAGKARPGPTWREAVLMHAVSRLVFNELIPNIQASWVKLGTNGAKKMLSCGANDLGGVLMNESITSAAGAQHGQQQDAQTLRSLIHDVGKRPVLRSTLYRIIDLGETGPTITSVSNNSHMCISA